MKKSFLFLARHSGVLAVFFLISFLAGCISSNTSSRKVWKNVKMPELISQQQPSENKSMFVGLYIYIFHIQADKLTEIQEQISRTDALSVKYNDPAAFSANGLVDCAGDRTSWQKIAELLAQSQPQTREHINLLITENIINDIVVAQTPRPVSVTYYSNGATAGIGFDAGRIALRLKVSSLIGLRQVCRLDITPVYKTGLGQKAKKSSVEQENYEFAFESAALNVRLQPGWFVLLAPAQTQTDPNIAQTIGDIMSYSQTDSNAVNLCLIACNLINSPL
jgi:hypothetical protein